MNGWIIVTKQLLDNGGEAMLIPALYGCKRKTKLERVVCVTADVLYYTIRYVVLKTAFNT
jgi:hypothetical protein